MSIKNLIIIPIATVITVFLATVAFNLANDPGTYLARISKLSEIRQILREQTDLKLWRNHPEWQGIVDKREAELQKKRDASIKRAMEYAEKVRNGAIEE